MLSVQPVSCGPAWYSPCGCAPRVSARQCVYPLPLEHLSTSLTLKNALRQHHVLGQTGIRSQHVGAWVIFAQYSAKGASLAAVMPAVWLSPEFAHRVGQRHLDRGAIRPGLLFDAQA